MTLVSFCLFKGSLGLPVGFEPKDSSMGDLEPITQASDSQCAYHSIVIPKEDESCFGDQAWTMGVWDG